MFKIKGKLLYGCTKTTSIYFFSQTSTSLHSLIQFKAEVYTNLLFYMWLNTFYLKWFQLNEFHKKRRDPLLWVSNLSTSQGSVLIDWGWSSQKKYQFVPRLNLQEDRRKMFDILYPGTFDFKVLYLFSYSLNLTYLLEGLGILKIFRLTHIDMEF